MLYDVIMLPVQNKTKVNLVGSKKLLKDSKMSMNSVVPPFRRLLNSISDDLSPQNLQSLIHICGGHIPESRRGEIRSGLDVFHILMQQDLIGDDLERLLELKQIVKTMRPKRKDIVRRVKEYIICKKYEGYDFQSTSGESCDYRQDPPAILVRENNYQEPVALDRYAASGMVYSNVQSNPFLDVRPFSRENHCSMDCCCWGCNCYTRAIPSCMLLVLAVIMAAVTFFSGLLWFEGIPHALYSQLARSPDGMKAGGYIVGAFGAATIGILSWWFYRKIRHHRRNVGQIPYEGLTDEYPMNSWNNVVEKAPISPPNATIQKRERRPLGSASSFPDMHTAASAPILERYKKQRGFAAKRLRRPRRHRKRGTEEGELQLEGTSGPERSDDEALVTV